MRHKWIALAAALAFFSAAAQAKEDAKAKSAPSAPVAPDKAAAAKPPAKTAKQQVNLNAASAKELKGLPGGSDDEAARIIAGRPYNSKAFLVTNNVISAARYNAIKALVVAGEPPKLAAGAKTSSGK